MLKKDIKVRSSEGAEFDCYLVTPRTEKKVPAIVLASAIFGVDQDLRGIADEFASRGYIAAAPDLFWRSVPGPLVREAFTSAYGQALADEFSDALRNAADPACLDSKRVKAAELRQRGLDLMSKWGTYAEAERWVRQMAVSHADDPEFIAAIARLWRLSASPGAIATRYTDASSRNRSSRGSRTAFPAPIRSTSSSRPRAWGTRRKNRQQSR